MTTVTKSIVGKSLVVLLATSFLATPVLSATQAEAGQRDWNKHHDHYVVVKKKKKKKHYNNNGDLLAAGIIGLALGAIIADQTRPRTIYVQPNPVYVPPRPVYVQPQPTYDPYVERRSLHDTYYNNDYDRYDSDRRYRHDDGPTVIRYEDEIQASYEPWSQGWAAWCDSKYRSFNPNTGTYRGYDGLDHFCVVK